MKPRSLSLLRPIAMHIPLPATPRRATVDVFLDETLFIRTGNIDVYCDVIRPSPSVKASVWEVMVREITMMEIMFEFLAYPRERRIFADHGAVALDLLSRKHALNMLNDEEMLRIVDLLRHYGPCRTSLAIADKKPNYFVTLVDDIPPGSLILIVANRKKRKWDIDELPLNQYVLCKRGDRIIMRDSGR
jgi:hypothetical protein